ncbi:MAG: O-antigen ligase family protein [Actinomycetota bacterium]|nr:O-antigen ligase family protein [Actinomycetota bacterium]
MPVEARLVGAFVVPLVVVLAITPLAIRFADRVGFHDKPVGYKGHARPTPYLGGAAVVLGFLTGALLLGGASRLALIPLGALVLWAVGTADDRVAVPPAVRVSIELGVAAILFAGGLGWSVFGSPVPDFLLTALWVVGLINAFNLMDNMDGATSTIAALSGMGTAAFALVLGDPVLAVLAVALAGACLGFLRYNLATPARIFLGDGGSMPIGFLVAALIMALPLGEDTVPHRLLAAALLAGLPILDTTLVVVSRRRAGVSFLQGGRDHLTHRLRTRLVSARAVALALAGGQLLLCLLALGVVRLGDASIVLAWVILLSLAAAAVALLESAAWAPVRPAPATLASPRFWSRGRPELAVANARRVGADDAMGSFRTGPEQGPTGFEPAPEPTGTSAPTPPILAPLRPAESVIVVAVALVAGLSPLFYGFYNISTWGPIALILLAVLFGLVVARPALPRPPALLAIGGLVALWAWSLLSTGWAESAESALIEANRWMLYAALLAILVLLLRDDRVARLLLATTTLVVVGLGLYVVAEMLQGGGPDLFLLRRLHEPLGYANGQAAYFLLGFWPLVAVAERARNALLAGGALGAAALLAALVLLSQSRAAIAALIVVAGVMLVAVPGRRRRAWALVALAAGVAAGSGPLLAVYQQPVDPTLVSAPLVREAAATSLLVALGVGGVWALVRWTVGAVTSRSPRSARPLGLASGGVLVVAGLVGVVFLAGLIGNPAERVANQYREFTKLQSQAGGESRFTSGGGNRFEYWRIAFNQFETAPVRGLGAGNYERTYFLQRRITEAITQPHSLEIQTLAELGVIGGLMVAIFVVGVLIGFGRRALSGRRSACDAGLAVAGGGAFLVWLVQTSVDWLHLIPGVTAVAVCAGAVLVAPWAGRRRPISGSRSTKLVVVACAALVVFATVQLGRSTLADLNRQQAREALERGDPARALIETNEALALDDESLRTWYLKAAAYARRDDYLSARAALGEAVRREPNNFVTWALLGDLATRRGDFPQAARDYARSLALNPRDPELAALLREARRSS